MTGVISNLAVTERRLRMKDSGSLNTFFGFLSLPREIRDRVYLDVLEGELDLPLEPKCIISRRFKEEKEAWKQVSDCSWRSQGSCWYESNLPRLSCQGLLRCNRQISGEVVQAIRYHASMVKNRLTYKLDCMYQNYRVWPTWLALPAPLRYRQDLEMNLRIFGDKEPPLKAIVDRLLRGFLTFGPGFVYGRKIRQAICMRSVTISVVRVHRPNTPMDKVAGHRMDGIIQRSLEELVWNLHHLRRTGTLYGKVELLRICYYGRVHEMKITSPEDIPDNSTDPKKWDDHAWISERRA